MAAKRVSKSVVDWAAFAALVPKNQSECYKAFKSKSDLFLSRVHKHPENLPAIDFAAYKTRITTPGIVDALEKGYAALSIPYPKDKANMKAAIDADEKASKEEAAQLDIKSQELIKNCQFLLDKIQSIPHADEFTLEMYEMYFPPKPPNDNMPSMFPFDRTSQPHFYENEKKLNLLLPRSWWEKTK